MRELWKGKLLEAQTENDLTATLLHHVKKDAAIVEKMKSAVELSTAGSDSDHIDENAATTKPSDGTEMPE